MVAVATLATATHLGHAHALAASIADMLPTAERVLLWVDAPDSMNMADVAMQLGFHSVLVPAEVCAPETVYSMRTCYTVAEFCFALKPALLRTLMELGKDKVIYLDADTALYSSLEFVIDELSRSSIVLTPHITQPLPDDGHVPSDISILMAGAFNLGFLGVGNDAEGRRFLDWWVAKEERQGYVDLSRGLCGDQRWCDMVPALFDRVCVCKHPGLNVGYWNLPSRPIRRRAEGWECAGAPLVLFHFSGFDFESPMMLSRFQDRIVVRSNSDLFRLLSEHAERLRASGHRVAGLSALASKRLVDLQSSSCEGFEPESAGAVHVRQLARMPVATFVTVAYRALLGRAPDPEGAMRYTGLIAERGMSRWEVLARLRLSEEGRRRGASVKGMWTSFAFALAYGLPIVGSGLAWLARALRLPRQLQPVARTKRR